MPKTKLENYRALAALGALSALGASYSLPEVMVYPDTTKNKKSKCGLPSCMVETKGAYCCAEHCKEHKALGKVKSSNLAYGEGETVRSNASAYGEDGDGNE